MTVMVPVSLSKETRDRLHYYREEKGMIIGRAVDKILDIYTLDENITFALMSIHDRPLTGGEMKVKYYNISKDVHERIKMLSQMTSFPMGRIMARCITHAMIELDKGLEFGSTLPGFNPKK